MPSGRAVEGVLQEQLLQDQADEHFRLTFLHAPIGMALVGLDGRWLRVNRQLCAILGRTEAELAGLTFQEITHPDDLGDDLALRAELDAGRIDSYRMEKRYLRPDGEAVPCELTVGVVRAPDHTPLHYVAHVSDLTERLAFERSLRQQEERLRALAEGAQDFMLYQLRLEPTLAFEYLSEGIEAICGYTAEEFRQRAQLMFELVHPDDAPALMALLADPDGAGRELVARWRHRDGREIWTKSRNTPVLERGRMVGIEGLLFDITSQKHAEEAHHATEARYRALVQHSSDVLIVTDVQFTISYVTPSVQRIFGWEPTDVSGRDISHLLHPDDVEVIRRRALRTTIATRSPVQLRLRTNGGKWRWMEALVTNLLDEPAVAGIVINARDIHEQKTAEDALQTAAVTDSLTGLPNRTLLEDRVQRALTRHAGASTKVAVLAVDIDRFHVVNDAFGHAGGDKLLVEVARRLRKAVPDPHTVGRFAADEFIVCVEGLDDSDDAVELARQIRSTVAEPIDLEGITTTITASLGVAAISTADATAAEAIRRATLAVQQAQAAGGDAVRVYDPQLADHAETRHYREQGLRAALEAGEFITYYQPIVDLHTGAVIGAEALVRWLHPTDGIVAPGQFIPIAEETGLIIPLGRWVVDNACRQLAEWRRLHGMEELTVSVNLSARQCGSPDVVAMLDDTIRRHGLPPEALVIEVTETAALQQGHLERLHDIHALGIRIALDDFGTHYSSLSYLQRLPVQTIKIDRSFVDGVNSNYQHRAIVMAVSQLARGLRLTTVGEGIENEQQAADLILLGVDRGQGYLYGHPVPASEFPIDSLSHS